MFPAWSRSTPGSPLSSPVSRSLACCGLQGSRRPGLSDGHGLEVAQLACRHPMWVRGLASRPVSEVPGVNVPSACAPCAACSAPMVVSGRLPVPSLNALPSHDSRSCPGLQEHPHQPLPSLLVQSPRHGPAPPCPPVCLSSTGPASSRVHPNTLPMRGNLLGPPRSPVGTPFTPQMWALPSSLELPGASPWVSAAPSQALQSAVRQRGQPWAAVPWGLTSWWEWAPGPVPGEWVHVPGQQRAFTPAPGTH